MKTNVLVVVFDGCRPDGLAQAHTPNVDSLWQAGAYTWTAQSIAPSITLPTHMSMWRGVTPNKHGIDTNTFKASAATYPSAIEIAHQARLSTAMFYSWEELRDLSAPGHLDMSYYRAAQPNDGTDSLIADAAAVYLATRQPHLAFVYFGDTDLVGHAQGWMSAPYLAAIEQLDRALGALLCTLEQASLRDRYTVLLLADHGGHDYQHGTALAEDLTIPWILNGPSVRRGHPLQQPVCITDTAATIAHLLDVPRPAAWDGQPVFEAFVD